MTYDHEDDPQDKTERGPRDYEGFSRNHSEPAGVEKYIGSSEDHRRKRSSQLDLSQNPRKWRNPRAPSEPTFLKD